MKSKKNNFKNMFLYVALIAIAFIGFGTNQVLAAPGAIFTTDLGCGGVNINIYDSKGDVYLNGGPNGGGPGLPEGDYYVQVTEPDGTVLGKTVLASVRVNADGKFAQCYRLTEILFTASSNPVFSVAGYDTTTNPGGEYKVWVSKDPNFANSQSKTDNFKVREPIVCDPPCEQPPPPVSIEGIKFYDTNQNGIKDDGEPVIPGWRIELYKVGESSSVSSTDTDADGAYEFIVDYSETQQYKVREVLPENGNWSRSNTTDLESAALTANENHTDINFGNIRKAKLSGLKFRDANMNGVRDSDGNGGFTEGIIPNITIEITTTEPATAADPSPTPQTKSVMTDVNGEWMSGLHPVGTTYTVCENLVPTPQYFQTAPTQQPMPTPNCYSGTLSFMINDNSTPDNTSDDFTEFFEPVDKGNLNFGNIGLVSIGGTKYKDADMSKGLSTGDTVVISPSVTINITDIVYPNGSPQPNVTTSTVNGVWSLSGLPEGTTFKACEVVPTGWIATTDSLCRTGTAGATNVDFFNIPVFSIGGTKYYDSNVNGSLDSGEGGVSGVTINVTFTRPDNTPGTGTATTDSGGAWTFSPIPEGSTMVKACEVVPTGWVNTAPICLSLSGGMTGNVTGQNFFNVKLITPNGGKTLGFWSNNNGKSVLSMDDPGWRSYLNSLNLAKGATNSHIYVLNTAASFNDVYNGKTGVQTPGFNPWLLNANSTNMAYMLSVQLAANTLDVKEGSRLQSKGYVTTPLTGDTTVSLGTLAPCINVIRGVSSDFITLSDLHAMAVGQLALGRYTVAASTLRTNQDCVKTTLDKVNNNALKVVAPAVSMAQ